MKLSELYLDRFLYRQSQQSLETKDSIYNSSNVTPAIFAALAAGGAAQDINTGNVLINGAQLEPGTYPMTVLDISNWGWGQTCVFSSSDIDTVAWGAGTFKSADGTSYAISAGNTGNMAAKTYIYFDILASETVYQTTTTPANAVGVGKVLVAVAENSAVVGTLATYNLNEATQITGDNILANSINASKIVTGQLIVGTNVGLGTAQDSAGVTTIIGNVVTTGFVNALNVTAQYIVASVSITTPTITGGTITIGTGNAVFKADSNGIYLGNAVFASAPFRVSPTGAVTASDITITGGSIQWSTIAGTTNAPASNATVGATWNSNISGQPSDSAITNPSYITSTKITATTIESPTISGGTLTIGSGNSIFKANTDGIYLGNATFASAPFRVDLDGNLVATQATIQTSTGNSRVVFTSDSIRFYSGGTLRSTIDGSADANGGMKNSGDFFVANNRSYWIASSTGGSTEYGGIGVTNANQLWITCGTANTFYIFNNAQTLTYISGSNIAIVIGNGTNILDLIPHQSVTQDLGDSTHIWDDVWCSTVGRQSGNAIWFDQAGRIQVDNHFDPSGAGSYNCGGSTRYWNDISYKTLTDRGCLGWFDEGVELQDGRKVTDTEAIQNMKKHPTKKTIYGVPMLDYTTFPKVSYKKATKHDGTLLPRNKNDEPYETEINPRTKKKETTMAQDGIEMTSVFSIMLGAIKELDNRLKELELKAIK